MSYYQFSRQKKNCQKQKETILIVIRVLFKKQRSNKIKDKKLKQKFVTRRKRQD